MRQLLTCAFLLTALTLLAACGSSVNQSNYDKIKNDMTVADVEAILGKPTDTKSAAGAIGALTGSGQSSVWKSGEKEITVTFANGKVIAKTQKNL